MRFEFDPEMLSWMDRWTWHFLIPFLPERFGRNEVDTIIEIKRL